VRRAKREHRLTDLFALVAEAHSGFANRLFDAAGLSKVAVVRAQIEVPTRRGRSVDLELLGLDGRGTAVARLWSENKTGAAYQPNQLPDYAEDLPLVPAQRQLITVVDDPSEVPVDDLQPQAPRWRGFTWREVAVMAWEAGRAAADPPDRPVWRQAALRPTAPASERMLVELLSYLEEEHGVVLDPLGHENVAAFAHFVETGQVIEEVVKRASEFAAVDVDDAFAWSEDLDSLWQCFVSDGTWAAGIEGYPELQAADTDRWSRNRIGEPAFGVGYTLPGRLAQQLLSTDSRTWRDAVEAAGFSVFADDDDDFVRVWRTKYLAELIPAGVTLDMQAHELARWVDDSLSVLAQHDPGVTLPPKPSRRRRTSSDETAPEAAT
jgi:hypothetical protein